MKDDPPGLPSALGSNLARQVLLARQVADEGWMREALDEARLALLHRVPDVPVGAIVVDSDGRIIGRGRNRREDFEDPTAHAEVEALREAAASRGRWRLDGATLVVTLEPCAMCAGALVNARVSTLVYGAKDPKAGAVVSLFGICTDSRLNHRLDVRGGILEEPCARLLREFFRERRRGGRTSGTG